MWDVLFILWRTLVAFVIGTFGSVIAGALLQTCGVRFWLKDFMVSPGAILFGVIAGCLWCIDAIHELPGFNRWRRQSAERHVKK